MFVVHRQKVDDSLAGETPLDRILIAVGETETRTKAPTAMADGVPVSPIIRGKGVRIADLNDQGFMLFEGDDVHLLCIACRYSEAFIVPANCVLKVTRTRRDR